MAGQNSNKARILGLDAEVVYTGLRLLAYYSVFTVVLLVVLPQDLIYRTQLLTAEWSEYFIRLSGLSVTRDGVLLYLANITLQIDFACTAITIAALYTSLILAYRAPWEMRVFGVVAGLAAIEVANITRIVATAFTAVYAPNLMHTFHDYLFQVSMVVVAVALWAWWFSLLARAQKRGGVERG